MAGRSGERQAIISGIKRRAGRRMDFAFEQVGSVGIFILKGELTGDSEDVLKIVLMKAIHSMDRGVLNFKEVTRIDHKCLQLIKQAYAASVRLKTPLILTEVPQNYVAAVIRNNNNGSFANACADDTTKVALN
jgi:anti-anti-sigma regulatory factor